MARKLRLQFKGAFNHVFHRGNRREPIFLATADYRHFETFLFEAAERCEILLYDWALMPNHFHLVVQTSKANLSQFMQRLLTRYAVYFNWRYTTVGHVFQGRYGAKLCDKEEYFLTLIQYVELNPYRLKNGLSLARLGEWHWTALRFYMGQEPIPKVCERAMGEVLSRFGQTLDKARKEFSRFLADGLKNEDGEAFFQPGPHGILGDDVFVEEVNRRLQLDTSPPPARFPHFAAILKECARCFDVSVNDVCGASQRRELNRIRQALARLARESFGFAVCEIAIGLQRSATAVTMMLIRTEKNSPSEEVERLRRWLGAAD